eukprot:PhF_6_TR25128/c0_g1_i4/m.34577
MSDEESVQVAVRVRPFNKREVDASASYIIEMKTELTGSRTKIRNPDTGEERDFNLDYSFQSFDSQESDFATQNDVYETVGSPVLKMALEGVNVCLFAYGQTGAGKSFSMLGKQDPPSERGIIPRVCRAIFDRIEAEVKVDPTIKSQVSIQVVEVYCEQINDLLAPRNKWPPHGHKPRMSKDGYVVDTTIRPCKSFEEIQSAFKVSDFNRSVGSHLLNSESSRAHTIYTIQYERRRKLSEREEETICSRINLVDLAGSERCDVAGTSGQTLKEGTMINKSLSTLGNAIRALSEAKKPNFRDSKLTLLLQGSMTNGRVLMIAALSPASICYEETLSTLRFAERIKKVKIRAKKNVTMDAVAEVRKEMEDMRKKLMDEIEYWKTMASSSDRRDAEEGALQEAMRELDADISRQISNTRETLEEKDARSKQIGDEWEQAFGAAMSKEQLTVPHLLNLNEDLRLSETLVYPFDAGDTVIGKSDKQYPPVHEFNGVGMKAKHCIVRYDAEAGKCDLTPGPFGGPLYVNGEAVKDTVELKHNCRIWMGTNYAFRFAFPGHEEEGYPDAGCDYLTAEAEIVEKTKPKDVTGDRGGMNHILFDALRRVDQANTIAIDLEYRVTFEPRIVTDKHGKRTVVVVVKSPNVSLTWPYEKFLGRLASMSEMWQEWRNCDIEGTQYIYEGNDNPFVDDEYQLIGESNIWLRSLGNMIETDFIPRHGFLLFQVWGKHKRRRSMVEATEVLPEGWKKVTAYMDPEGGLHLEAPGARRSQSASPLPLHS